MDVDGRRSRRRPAPDSVWVDLVARAEALNRTHGDGSLEVRAVRRHRLWDVRDGLDAVDHSTDVVEPARTRRPGIRRWREVASVEMVTARILEFLDQRPDLR